MAGSLALALIGGWLVFDAVIAPRNSAGSWQAAFGVALIVAAIVLPFV